MDWCLSRNHPPLDRPLRQPHSWVSSFHLCNLTVFPVTVAVSCINLALKSNDSGFMFMSKPTVPTTLPRECPSVAATSWVFPLRHLFCEFLLLFISSPVSTQVERTGTVVVCGERVCAFCGSRYQTGRGKTCFCWRRHVILMLSRLTETQQSNGIWTKFRWWHQPVPFWTSHANKMPFL